MQRSLRCSAHGCRLDLLLPDAGQLVDVAVGAGAGDPEHVFHIRQHGARGVEVRTGPLVHGRRYRIDVTYDLPYAPRVHATAAVVG